ncbi:hypothetical protein HZH66_001073 [Vespula vulgaris]|uniref:CCHC-type domain-containing protein n=1 Tax=Vespula vulgaris TaxID=7454 RepID=A0A834KSM2_VESVU|nr:hypothetical protein HZH66_001073 [Vespula vulgaris]
MFHHRPSRKILKIESSRNVIEEESFRDYIHEKIILSSILRDQARVSGLTTKTDLLTAFERINLWERKLPGGHVGKDCSTKNDGPKCFHCGERGHIAVKYQYIKLGSLTSVPEETRCRGVGLNKNVTPGEFLVELTVDGNSYSVLIRVVSDCS